jgi:DNA repair protein RadC
MPRNYTPTTTEPLARLATVAAELLTIDHPTQEQVSDPDTAGALFGRVIGDADREYALALHLDTKHRPLALRLISVGSLDHTFLAPREIYRSALLDNAAAVIIAHNHPSGDPEPSRDDERVTRRIAEAGRTVGVELLDALVIGADGRWVSMARRGLL